MGRPPPTRTIPTLEDDRHPRTPASGAFATACAAQRHVRSALAHHHARLLIPIEVQPHRRRLCTATESGGAVIRSRLSGGNRWRRKPNHWRAIARLSVWCLLEHHVFPKGGLSAHGNTQSRRSSDNDCCLHRECSRTGWRAIYIRPRSQWPHRWLAQTSCFNETGPIL